MLSLFLIFKWIFNKSVIAFALVFSCLISGCVVVVTNPSDQPSQFSQETEDINTTLERWISKINNRNWF